MTSTMTSHATCTHPATKAGRAACRKARASQATRDAIARAEIRAAYEAGVDIAILLGMMAQLGIDINTDLDIEELIDSL